MLIPDDNNKSQKVSFMHANQMLLEGLAALGNFSKKLDGLFNNNNNMETKEMKIVPPEGYEIDKENSTFEIVRFKPIKKALTYEEVVKELFFGNDVPFIDAVGKPRIGKIEDCYLLDPNNCTSIKQCEKLLAINKLMNVAKYLNGDWKPDWGNKLQIKFYIAIYLGNLVAYRVSSTNNINVFFKSEEAAQQASDILGEETIRLALSTVW